MPAETAQPVLVAPALLEAGTPEWPAGLDPARGPQAVTLELTVDPEGAARDVVVLESAGPELDAAALSLAQTLRFSPATRDGTPIAARIPFRFDFAPPEPPPPPPPPAAPEPPPPPVADTSEEPLVAEGVTLEVRGEKPPREPTVHRVEAEQVRVIPGTNGDALRAIETLPGVGRPAGINGDLIVRGAAPQDTAIFIEGLSVPIAYHFGGISSVIPTEALSRLDFRPGNFGAEYGRAMGGVIDIGLRSPRSDRFGGVLQFDVIDGRLMVEGPLGKHTRMLVGARRSWVDAWIGKTDPSLQTAPVYWDGQAVLEHDFSAKTRARLIFFGADDRLSLLQESPPTGDPIGGRLSAHTMFTRLGLQIESELTDDLRFKQTIGWGVERYDFFFGGDYSDVFLHEIMSRTELRYRMNDMIAGVIGGDVTWTQYDVDMRIRPYPATDEVDGPYFARPSRRMSARDYTTRPAAYALLELTPTRSLRIVPALRADYTHDTGNWTFDPRLTARWDVHSEFPRTTLKGGVGLFHQPPQPQESIEPFGTPGVRSNRALHSSFGVEQEFLPGFDVSLEGFYKHLDDLIVGLAAEDETQIGARFVNTGRGRAYGGELLLRYRPADAPFFGWIAYTLSRSQRANNDREALHTFEWDQTHILSALGNLKLRRGWSVGARFRYVTGAPDTPYLGGVLDLDAGAYAPVAGTTPFTSRLAAFHQLDLRVDKTWLISMAKLTAYLELRNAYNRKNVEETSYSYDYAQSGKQTGLPLLPVIGLRGEL